MIERPSDIVCGKRTEQGSNCDDNDYSIVIAVLIASNDSNDDIALVVLAVVNDIGDAGEGSGVGDDGSGSCGVGDAGEGGGVGGDGSGSCGGGSCGGSEGRVCGCMIYGWCGFSVVVIVELIENRIW